MTKVASKIGQPWTVFCLFLAFYNSMTNVVGIPKLNYVSLCTILNRDLNPEL